MMMTQVKIVTKGMLADNSSEDKVLAAGPWSEEEEEFIIIPETVTTRSSRVAGSASTVALH